jgi:thymidylate synthase (FAD)
MKVKLIEICEGQIMTEENKFKEVDSMQLYNDGIGYVKLYDASHANESEEQRIWTVTTISSLAYGNEEAKHPNKLYKKLQQLGHESLAEFIVDTYPATGIAHSMRNAPLDYDDRYSTPQNIVEHKENIACFRIKVPLFVARQFMRHRSFSYLEMSRRYTKGSKVPFEFWFPEEVHPYFKKDYSYNQIELYKNWIDDGYETQVASRFLPQTTYTEFYCMTNTEGLKNFFKLRCDSHAQKEIQYLSFSMLKLLYTHQYELYKKVAPDELKYLFKAGK